MRPRQLVEHRHPNPQVQEVVEALRDILSSPGDQAPLDQIFLAVLTGVLYPASAAFLDRLLQERLFQADADFMPAYSQLDRTASQRVLAAYMYRKDAVWLCYLHFTLGPEKARYSLPLGIAKKAGVCPEVIARREREALLQTRQEEGWRAFFATPSEAVQLVRVEVP